MKVDTLLAAGDWPALPGEARRSGPGLLPDQLRALLTSLG